MQYETEIKRDYLSGIKPADIALKYNYTENQIYDLIARKKLKSKKTELNRKQEAKLVESIEKNIEKLTELSLKTYFEILENHELPINIRLKAADSIQNINGLKKQTVSNPDNQIDVVICEATPYVKDNSDNQK